MSWTLKAAGTKGRVKEIVAAEEHIPPQVKQVINANVEGTPTHEPYNGVLVHTYGHMGASGEVKIEVYQIKL